MDHTCYLNKLGKITQSLGGAIYENMKSLDVVVLDKKICPGMRFPTMWHFGMCRLRRACAASF